MRVKDRTDRHLAWKMKSRVELSRKIRALTDLVESLEKDSRIAVVNVDRRKNIEVALVIKEGEEQLDECRRNHVIAWERREASASVLFAKLAPVIPSYLSLSFLTLHRIHLFHRLSI